MELPSAARTETRRRLNSSLIISGVYIPSSEPTGWRLAKAAMSSQLYMAFS